MSPKHARSREYAIHPIRCTVSTSVDELYEVWYYPAFKERNQQCLQYNARQGVSESRLHTFEHLNCHVPNDMQISTSSYADSSLYHQNISSEMLFFWHKYRDIWNFPFLPYQNTSGLAI
ncbi:hypothetical protein TNCV_4178661 [Trichonephila clavipes]|nr:hypothetical protein TNCV_4178661 [Trichonephila clavipes]